MRAAERALSIACWALVICACALVNCPSAASIWALTASASRALTAFSFSWSSTMCICRVTAPLTVTPATPLMPSSLPVSSSVTKSLNSCTSAPSREMAATNVGIMEGFILSTYGEETVSSQLACRAEIFCWMSMLTVSMFTPSSNSSTTIETLS